MGTDNLHHKRKQNNLTRKKKGKNILPFILIVCEGEQTEPNYFSWYKDKCKQKVIIHAKGYGENTLSLVKKTQKIKKEQEKIDMIVYDQVWCVFDRDDFTQENYNNAFKYAEAKNINIAYSNECFELWYLLHFNYYNVSMKRDVIFEKLEKVMKDIYNLNYQKNSKNMFEILKEKQDIAIRNAEKLEKEIKKKYAWDIKNYNPSTSVHHLVKELNKYLDQQLI